MFNSHTKTVYRQRHIARHCPELQLQGGFPLAPLNPFGIMLDFISIISLNQTVSGALRRASERKTGEACNRKAT